MIEIDGESHLHLDQLEYDKARTEFLEELGYKVIRFTNEDVRYNIKVAVSEILHIVENRIAELTGKKVFQPTSHPNRLPGGERGKD